MNSHLGLIQSGSKSVMLKMKRDPMEHMIKGLIDKV